MTRKNFKFYRSYYEVAKELPKKDRLDYLMALLDYQFTGTHDELKGMARFAFMSQRHSIDAQIEGYMAKTEQPETQPQVFGTKGLFFIVDRKYIHERMQKVFEDGIKEYFEANNSVCNYAEKLPTFFKKYNGAKFNEFMHVFNALNHFKNSEKQGKAKAFDINNI